MLSISGTDHGLEVKGLLEKDLELLPWLTTLIGDFGLWSLWSNLEDLRGDNDNRLGATSEMTGPFGLVGLDSSGCCANFSINRFDLLGGVETFGLMVSDGVEDN